MDTTSTGHAELCMRAECVDGLKAFVVLHVSKFICFECALRGVFCMGLLPLPRLVLLFSVVVLRSCMHVLLLRLFRVMLNFMVLFHV